MTEDVAPVCPAHPEASLRPKIRGAEDRFWGFDGEFDYLECPECRSWVLNPRPPPSEIGHYYGGYYTDANLARIKHRYETKPARVAGFSGRMRALGFLRRMYKLDVKLEAGMRLLDVGTGIGTFPRFIRDMTQMDVRGVDFSRQCAAFAADVHDVRVDTGELAAQRYPDGHFKVVTAWHVLEHVYDPVAELREMARILEPDGWLVIEVPTNDVVGQLFGRNWLYLQPPTHLYCYRPSTVHAMMDAAGLEVVTVRRPWFPGEIAGSLLLAMGLREFIPKIFGAPDRPFYQKLLTVALYAQMVWEIPVGVSLALLGRGGLIRAFARKRS